MTKFKITSRNPTLRDFVSLPLKLFSAVGISFFIWSGDNLMTNKEKLTFVLILLNSGLCFIAEITSGLHNVFEDTVEFSEWLLYVSIAANGFFKAVSVIIGRKTLKYSFKRLEQLFASKFQKSRDFAFAQGLDFIMYYSKLMYKSQTIITAIFLALPIVQLIVDYSRTKVFVARFPFVLTYPFDVSHGLNYILAYISQSVGGFTVVCYFVASDMLLICSIYAVVLHFQELCHRIEHFKPESPEQDMDELRDILEKHGLLNKLAQDINSVFSVSILLNYMNNVTIVVLTGIQIVFSPNLLNFLKFFGLFLAYAIQIYFICMAGELLLQNSALVGEKFAGQKWYMADKRYQRMLPLAIVRSQKPAHLTAYKFFIISMESFSNLMTTSYQFFTLLKTRMEESDR